MAKIGIEDFTGYRFLSNLKFSLDGENICFTVSKADINSNSYLSQLWIYNLEDNNLFKLTSGKNDDKFVWLDKETIIFLSSRDEDQNDYESGLYKIDINGGEAEYLAPVPFEVKDFKIANSNTLIISGLTNINDGAKAEDDYQVLDEIPFWSNEDGFTNKKRVHLYSFDLFSKEFSKLIEGNYNVIDFDIFAEKVCINMKLFKGKMEMYSDLYLYNLEQRNLKKLTGNDKMIDFVKFIDHQTVIYSASDMKAMGVNSNKDIYQLNLEGEIVERRTHNLDKSFWISVCTDCRLSGGYTNRFENRKLYFLTTEDFNTYLNVLDDDGVKRLIDCEGSIDMFDIYQDKIAFIAFRDNKLQELYIYQNGLEKQISNFNTEVLADKNLISPEYFNFEASDGCKLDAWVMKPVDFKEGGKYPTILEIHGGPKTVYGSIFFHQFQVMVNRGYVVIYTNPRGSNGRGNQFADIRGGYGDRDYQDLMEFVDVAIDKFDFIDQDKLGVTGGSYGGYMTNWIVGHTDRFQAAVSQRSISNWISDFCTTDIGYFFVEDQFVGITPWNDYQKLWEASPLKYADRVSTPTLFIHSEQDYRCWVPEGIQMFTALKYYQITSRLVLFKGENHELSRSGKPKHRIRRLEEIMNWFDKFLR